MMQTYTIRLDNEQTYYDYMSGGNVFNCARLMTVKAENAEEAYAKAKAEHPELIVREYANMKSIEELRAEREARIKAEAEKKAQAKARRESKELAEAEALGLTVEELKAKKRKERAIKKAEEEIAELEKALAIAKARLEKLERA